VLSGLLAAGGLVAGTMGVQLQRQAAARAAYPPEMPISYHWLWLPAGLLAAGYQAGVHLSPAGILRPAGILPWLYVPVLIFSAGVLHWSWLATILFFARRLPANPLPRSRSRWAWRGLTVLSSFLLCALYLPLILAQVGINFPALIVTAPRNKPPAGSVLREAFLYSK